jgi:hypothetical protein
MSDNLFWSVLAWLTQRYDAVAFNHTVSGKFTAQDVRCSILFCTFFFPSTPPNSTVLVLSSELSQVCPIKPIDIPPTTVALPYPAQPLSLSPPPPFK